MTALAKAISNLTISQSRARHLLWSKRRTHLKKILWKEEKYGYVDCWRGAATIYP
jgi:hypothetical protein